MTEFNNIPDDFWRKAFNEADETPPPRVWDAIESRLDESRSSGIIPLWASGALISQPFVWGTGIAASVALLLVGWWLIGSRSGVQPVAHALHAPPTAHHAPEVISGNVTQPAGAQNATEAPAAVAQSAALATAQSAQMAREHQIATRPAPATGLALSTYAPSKTAIDTPTAARETTPTLSRIASLAAPVADAGAVHESGPVGALSPTFDPIAARAIHLRGPGAIHRIVWVQPTDAETNLTDAALTARSQPRHAAKPAWASLSVMPGSFNPSVSVRPGSAVAISALNNVQQASVTSRPEFSMAYQAGAGVQLTDRWSVESGIGYLVGRSVVESPGSAVGFYSAQVVMLNQPLQNANLYVDALRSSLQARAMNANQNTAYDLFASNVNNAFPAQRQYDAQLQQRVTNNYQFVQVPLQVGYQLRPKKRLSLALLGGFLTNIFVRNTVSDALVIRPEDGVYRPFALAANVGARFRYRPSPRWSASLAGIYQPTLGSATQSAAQVQSHPTATGMSFGVDYHF